VGRTEMPDDADRRIARREGWIHVPVGSLQSLRPTL
jgi:hypothetical protein